MEHFFPRIQVKTKKKGSSPEMEHFHSGEDQKKSSSTKMEHFFYVLICAQMHTRVKLLERMQMKTILKLMGDIQSNYWGDIFPHPPLVSAPLRTSVPYFLAKVGAYRIPYQRTVLPSLLKRLFWQNRH